MTVPAFLFATGIENSYPTIRNGRERVDTMIKVKIVCRLMTVVLLGLIFAILVLILRAMPAFPTEATLADAEKPSNWRLLKSISARIPLVAIHGAIKVEEPLEVTGVVGVDGNVDVNVRDITLTPGTDPIPVQIEH